MGTVTPASAGNVLPDSEPGDNIQQPLTDPHLSSIIDPLPNPHPSHVIAPPTHPSVVLVLEAPAVALIHDSTSLVEQPLSEIVAPVLA